MNKRSFTVTLGKDDENNISAGDVHEALMRGGFVVWVWIDVKEVTQQNNERAVEVEPHIHQYKCECIVCGEPLAKSLTRS